MKKPELLAPAGSMESLIAAINAGCDALYLGGYKFGARKYASFTIDELRTAVSTAHLFDVLVYVTVNTILYDHELTEVKGYLRELEEIGVDGVIIQDLGLINLLKDLTKLEIHASTQMHVHNMNGLKWCEKEGFDRVVVARETPIELIKKMKEETNVELEVFVHGALCV